METLLIIVQIIALVIVCSILIAQRQRISRLSVRPSLSDPEISVELYELVREEVSKFNELKLKELVKLDLVSIPLWEKNVHLQSHEAISWQEEIRQRVESLEEKLNTVEESEKIEVALALRELYWVWLKRARKNYASSQKYKLVRNHIIQRLQELNDQ